MPALAFDTLKLAHNLAKAGFTREQADGTAQAIAETFNDDVATKRDLKELETTLRRDMKELEASTKQDIAEVKRDIRESEQRVIIRLGSMMVVAVGVVAALVKLL